MVHSSWFAVQCSKFSESSFSVAGTSLHPMGEGPGLGVIKGARPGVKKLTTTDPEKS